MTFSLNCRNIKGGREGGAFARPLRRCDNKYAAAGKSRFVYFRFEPRTRKVGRTKKAAHLGWNGHIANGGRWRIGST